MSDDLADELRALRARAYGPDADIRDDPQALSRLRELESRAGGVPTFEPHARPASPPERQGDVSGVRPEASLDAPTATAAAVASATRRASWWERHLALVWGASLLVAAALGSAVVSAQQSPQSEQVAVLGQDAEGVWPEQMWGPRPPDGVTFEEYLGLTAIVSARDFGNSTNSTCLWVYDSDSINFGLSAGSCTAGSLPAATTIAVTSQAPAALLDRFTEGTTLQFVLDDDRVLVFAQRP